MTNVDPDEQSADCDLSDVPDGVGCVEIWELLSERREIDEG